MTEVNKQFIEACNTRLAEKEPFYGGDENPKNYKNMDEKDLVKDLFLDAGELDLYIGAADKPKLRKLCIDISNRCWMLWERLK
jgi:hypothetical protein